MKKDDARELDHQSLEAMCAAWRVQGGESPAVIARVVGVDRRRMAGAMPAWRLEWCECEALDPDVRLRLMAKSRNGFITR